MLKIASDCAKRTKEQRATLYVKSITTVLILTKTASALS